MSLQRGKSTLVLGCKYRAAKSVRCPVREAPLGAQCLYFEACKALMSEMKEDLGKGREAVPSDLSTQYCENISLPQI